MALLTDLSEETIMKMMKWIEFVNSILFIACVCGFDLFTILVHSSIKTGYHFDNQKPLDYQSFGENIVKENTW